MFNEDFSVSALFKAAASNIADSALELEFNVLSEFKTTLELEMDEDTAPEVIYTADAFAVIQDRTLSELISSQDVEELVGSFAGCSNASQCAEREANAIVDLVYQQVRNELFDDMAEMYAEIIEHMRRGSSGKDYTPVRGDVKITDVDMNDADAFDSRETDNGRTYNMYFNDSAKKFYGELIHSSSDSDPISIVIEMNAEEVEV